MSKRSLVTFAISLGLASFFTHSTSAQSPSPEMLKMLAGWKESLNLTEEQGTQVKGLMEQMSAKLDPLADKMEAEGEEADKKAAIGELKQIRKEFQASMATILNPEQQKAMGEIQQQIDVVTQTKIASKRAEKLQQQFSLSPEQTQRVVPVYVTQMSAMEEFVAKAQASSGDGSQPATKGGQRRARRAKIKQAKGLKSIGEDADKAIKEIMTSEQWASYKAFRDKQKEETKAKLKAKKG